MVNSDKDDNISTKDKAKKKKKKKRVGNIGCLIIILLFIGYGIFSVFMTTPQVLGDKDKVIEDIYRYHDKYGVFPESLDELKSKLADYKFEYEYYYLHNNEMFLIVYQGGGLAGDDSGEFYRSDTKEWEGIYGNWKKLDDLESKLRSAN